MEAVREKKCVPCAKGAPPASEAQVSDFLKSHAGWEWEKGQEPKLKKMFKFRDFRTALEFTNEIGRIAEEQNHHPSLLTAWGSVTVMWWTHKIRNIHSNDLIMAEMTDTVYDEFGK